MGIISARVAPARSDVPRRARLGVGLGVAAVIAVFIAPVALASPRASFGHGLRHEKHIGVPGHVASLRAAARALGVHSVPATPRRPMLRAPSARPASVTRRTTAHDAASAPLIVSAPDAVASKQFAGLTQAEAGNAVPADPWVGVNSGWVVQAVNSMVRISTRTGGELLSVPNAVLFGLPSSQFPSDPRIIWDAAHGRWVGSILSFNSTFSSNWLTLAVSDGADPTQGWALYPVSFGSDLPDYPSLASSNDKIVIADNLFDGGGSFLAQDINTFGWASILSGGAPAYDFCDDSTLVHGRAAQVLSSANDVHVVMESIADGHQVYVRVTGLGACSSIADFTDLTTTTGHDPLLLPPAPRQTGSDTIGPNAIDERFTDAIWQAGKLYWVSTYPVTYDGGSTWNDQVVIWGTTTPTFGSPVGFTTAQITPGNGFDAYMGGIGLTRGGSVVTTYSQSSSSTPISLLANRVTAGSLGTPLLLGTSQGASGSERWGDYAGVAMDPVGTGSAWASHMLAAADGTWRTEVVRLVIDGDLPTTPGAPLATTMSPTILTSSPKYRLSWVGASDASSGAVTYRLEQSVDAAGFGAATAVATTTLVRSVTLGHSVQFRVAAVDAVGNVGPWATGPVLYPSLVQSPTSKTGTWGTSSSNGYSGGTTWYAATLGATASYSSTGVRSIGFVTTRSLARGSFRVYIDGVYKATVSAYASATTQRSIVYQFSWSTPGTHSMKVYVLATSGHPRVDVDAFLVLK